MTGLFITLEGGDGAGKSTQAQLLGTWLTQRGERVTRTREPGGTALGQELRELLLHRDEHVDPRAEALLYAADRAQHIATIVRPALERGEIVLQDRYLDSSIAYQGSGRELSAEDIRGLSTWATHGLLPDLTILLDLDPREGRRRVAGARGGLDRLEAAGQAFHERVRSAYLDLADREPARFLVLDAAEPREHIQGTIRERVTTLLGRSEPAEATAPA